MKIETEFKDFFSDEPMTIKTTPPMNPEVEKLQNQVELQIGLHASCVKDRRKRLCQDLTGFG